MYYISTTYHSTMKGSLQVIRLDWKSTIINIGMYNGRREEDIRELGRIRINIWKRSSVHMVLAVPRLSWVREVILLFIYSARNYELSYPFKSV